jgi:hypothetical protein
MAQITLIYAMGFLLFVFFLRLLVRNDWLAIAIATGLLAAINSNALQMSWTIGPIVLIGDALIFFVLVRFGLVAFLSGALALLAMGSAPLALPTSAWYSGYGIASLLIVAALTLYGFHTSLGGRRIFDVRTADR